jgi:hypothetical protein
VRIPLALLHVPPLRGDDTQSILTVTGCTTFCQPTSNDETRSPNATTTVDSANSPAFLVVTQGLKNAFEKIDRGGEAAVLDGEAVIFDGGGFNSEDDSSLSQDALVRQQLAIFRQVNEGPNADTEEIVELGFVWVLGRPRVFASDEVWGGPVRIWQWPRTSGTPGARPVCRCQRLVFALQPLDVRRGPWTITRTPSLARHSIRLGGNRGYVVDWRGSWCVRGGALQLVALSLYKGWPQRFVRV